MEIGILHEGFHETAPAVESVIVVPVEERTDEGER